jgi:broad specificity phosphatase PhoE
MGHLTLVRHGQASFHAQRYDALSELGRRQARRLGEYWAERGHRFDAAWVGPRLRHRETVDEIAAAYRERGLPWPEARLMPELDEHDGLKVMRHALGDVRALAARGEPTDTSDVVRRFFLHYRNVMGDWAAGRLTVPEVESWSAFRARARGALATLCETSAQSVAFTSGGLIAATVGALLDLDDRNVIELSSVIRNAALTEIRYRPGEHGLVAFNTIPHLDEPTLVTMV